MLLTLASRPRSVCYGFGTLIAGLVIIASASITTALVCSPAFLQLYGQPTACWIAGYLPADYSFFLFNLFSPELYIWSVLGVGIALCTTVLANTLVCQAQSSVLGLPAGLVSATAAVSSTLVVGFTLAAFTTVGASSPDPLLPAPVFGGQLALVTAIMSPLHSLYILLLGLACLLTL